MVSHLRHKEILLGVCVISTCIHLPARASAFVTCPRLPNPGATTRLRGSAQPVATLDLFEKDVVEFMIGENLAQIAKAVELAKEGTGEIPVKTMLGAIVEQGRRDGLTAVQPLCIREEGSTELYGDSRLGPILVSSDRILRVSQGDHA